MEQDPTFCSRLPKSPTDAPDCRITTRKQYRLTHYYFITLLLHGATITLKL